MQALGEYYQACACEVARRGEAAAGPADPQEHHQPGQGHQDSGVQVHCCLCRIKKHQNKKFDKIVSLINYTITSADKALKYVNLSSNFEAEFAYKLYLSDRENLMNELNNLSLTEVLAQSGTVGYTNAIEMKGLRLEQPSSIIESNHLKQENDKLRKEIILLEN